MFNLFDTGTDDINYLIESAGTNILVNGTSQKSIITNNQIGDFEDRYIHSTQAIKRGDLINYNNENYIIITESVTQRNGKFKTLMRHTNYNLQMQLSNLDIISIPAIITNRTGGIDTDNYMILPDGTYQIIINSNEMTNTIARDKRFIFYGQAWIVTFVDKSHNGLLILTLKFDTTHYVIA